MVNLKTKIQHKCLESEFLSRPIKITQNVSNLCVVISPLLSENIILPKKGYKKLKSYTGSTIEIKVPVTTINQ